MAPEVVLPEWNRAYRMINSAFPPISLFEEVLDPVVLLTA
jgi:hypothetical protein